MQPSALITGASSGIGLAIARMLIGEGYGLTVVARRPEKLEAARAELEALGGDVIAVAANLTDEASIVEAVEAHKAKFGRLDLLVNNAGVGIGQPVDAITTKHFDLQFDTNVRAAFLFYRECVGLLKASAAETGVSRVVNTSSITALSPQPWLSAYSATKAAVRSLTISMNKELGTSGVHSTALCPGFVETPMTEFAQGGVPAEQMIRPEDIAGAVKMLLGLSQYCIVPEIPFIRPGEDAV
ncbi:MAG: SDR family oxidoreductase [Solirubrobacteraceae bacterium]|nr:SDR family oxidoreductase [Solirubrobacteraceae bacterium]